MCGIFFSLSKHDFVDPAAEELHLLRCRGPDSCRTVYRKLQYGLEDPICYLTVTATVLALRGDHVIEQPIEDSTSGSLLCWNGEAWAIDGEKIGGNDALAVFDLLLKATEPPKREILRCSSERALAKEVTYALGLISGPFAFLYFDARHQQLFFGRDVLGRRSLLRTVREDGCLIISSVPGESGLSTWIEIDANGIYNVDVAQMLKTLKSPNSAEANSTRTADEIKNIPWSLREGGYSLLRLIVQETSLSQRFNKTFPPNNPPQLSLDSPSAGELYAYLKQALSLRIRDIPRPPSSMADPARVGILFSGGLDCAILARMCHELLPYDQEIDLLNVAFENPRVVKAARKASSNSPGAQRSAYSRCPDRLTGQSTFSELLRVCPGRVWRFVSIDISYAEVAAHRRGIIALIYPHNTEMDLSIACALYFAARGVGTIQNDDSGLQSPYTTPTRVLLSGLGADELFAGYTRHSSAFERAGYEGLMNELQLDVSRLGKRNLGRDDRVISHWKKEARYPYLDETFVDWAIRLPVWEKCGFRQHHTNGDSSSTNQGPALEPAKLLLRLLASSLGMKNASSEKKRAIQFGARTAKMEAGNIKGNQRIS